MNLSYMRCVSIAIIVGLGLAGLSLEASQEFKAKTIKTQKPVTKLNPKVIKDIKNIDKIKMLSKRDYQKKLKAHDIKVKSQAKGVNTNAQANTRLKSQNKDFKGPQDCDDSKSDINPGAQEICDGIDNNCDGDVDMIGDRRLNHPFYLDADSDLYGDPSKVYYACSMPPGYSARNDDCNDQSVSINPGKEEIPNNDIDENCDGVK